MSSYYIQGLNDETNTNNNMDANKFEQDYLNSTNLNLTQNILDDNPDASKENDHGASNFLSSKLENYQENKNQVRFIDDESNERLNLVENLPEISLNLTDTTQKFSQKTSISSESQTNNLSNLNNSTNPLYYELKIKLVDGKNLAIRDIGGSSDPYAKFVLNGINVFKSKIIFKNLNPEWNEDFFIKLSPSILKNKANNSNNIQSVLQNFDSNTVDEPLEAFLSKFRLKMYIYDYDRGFFSDDLIGYSMIDLTYLKENM